MRVRNPRTHFSGYSNRLQARQPIRPQTVFERSIKKSQSVYHQSSTKIQPQKIAETDRVKPFMGTHCELQTLRFDKNNFKQYKEKDMIIPAVAKPLTFATYLNKQVEQIVPEFADKKINMHKLFQLKHTFVKNNKNRRNMKKYFKQYAKEKNQIESQQFKKIVKQYGFDVNDDQTQLIFRLTNRKSIDDQRKDKKSLNIEGFVELMTKQDIHFKTLRVGNNRKSFTKPQKIFSDKVHQILRNKFPKMKEAFEIYTKRKEKVGINLYNKIMKRLDLTDLVISESQRTQLFNTYSHDGSLNVEKLLCDIIEDEHNRGVKLDKNYDFVNDIHVNEEKDEGTNKKIRNFSLKNLSFLEYQNQLLKAQQIIDELRKIQKQQNRDVVQEISNHNQAEKRQICKNTQNLLKKEGINFKKQEYDAFLSYLDFDTDGSLSKNKLRNAIFQESEKEARERFERKFRNEEPKLKQLNRFQCDKDTALQAIKRIRSHKMNPQNKQLFKYLDKDKDGYISEKQLKQQLSKLQILQKWQVQNLASYLDSDNKGSLKYDEFAKRVDPKQQLPFVKRKHSLSYSDWKTTKKNSIMTFNAPRPYGQINTKYSAWPYERRQSDLSLIQPAVNSALYASQTERFGQKRQEYALKQKLIVNNVMEGRRQNRSKWNNKIDERKENDRIQEEKRLLANNYFLRLTKQAYEERAKQ